MHQVVARLPDVLVMSRTAFLTASDEQRTKKQNGSKWNLCKRTERICKLPEWILLPSRILLGRAIFFVNFFPFFLGIVSRFLVEGRCEEGRKEGAACQCVWLSFALCFHICTATIHKRTQRNKSSSSTTTTNNNNQQQPTTTTTTTTTATTTTPTTNNQQPTNQPTNNQQPQPTTTTATTTTNKQQQTTTNNQQPTTNNNNNHNHNHNHQPQQQPQPTNTNQPTKQPTNQPSNQPTNQLTNQPSIHPSNHNNNTMQIRELSCKTLQIPIKTIKPQKTGKKIPKKKRGKKSPKKIAALLLVWCPMGFLCSWMTADRFFPHPLLAFVVLSCTICPSPTGNFFVIHTLQQARRRLTEEVQAEAWPGLEVLKASWTLGER